jgi:hypothetical protein
MAKFFGKVTIVLFFIAAFFSMFFDHGIGAINQTTIFTVHKMEIALAIIQIIMVAAMMVGGMFGAIILGWHGLRLTDK